MREIKFTVGASFEEYHYNFASNSWELYDAVNWPQYPAGYKTHTLGVPTATNNGYKFVTPYAYYRYSYKEPSGEEITYYRSSHKTPFEPYYRQTGINYYRHIAGGQYLGKPLSPEQLEQRALANLDSRGDSTNMEMLTKDLVDAMHLTSEYAGRLLRAIPHLKKGRFSKAWKAFNSRNGQLQSNRKVISNEWLAFQWGVKPSIEAVINAYELATDSDEKRTFRITSTAGEQNAYAYYYNSMTEYKQVGVREQSMKIIRYFRNISNRDFASLWNNPMTPAWDAIPYSFLLDWFAPIGSYLKQFSYFNDHLYDISGVNCYRSNLRYSFNVTYLTINGDGKHVMKSDEGFENIFSRSLSSRIHASYTLGDIVDQSSFGLTRGRTLNLIALCNQKLG